jgi:hypothetical protein
MSAPIPPPFITGKTDAERIRQLEEYIELLVNQLNDILSQK